MKLNLQSIKEGDFINASYKFGCVAGRVKKVYKNYVVVSKHQQNISHYTDLNVDLNVKTSRIYDINNPNNTYS